MSEIWIEKYRPEDFSEVKGQDIIIDRIKSFVENQNMPHLLFAGPAGVGKTTTSLIIARKLFGDEWQNSFLELNASDERGIDVVRTKVKDFARTKSIGNVPFKIIYLDECDALTKEAQQALRRTMENYAGNTRFILSCNYISKIIDPIQSRCSIFKFKNLEFDEIVKIIDSITLKESLKVTDDAKKALFEVSGGDCRRLENVMQACATISKEITEEVVYSISASAKPKEILEVLNTAIQGKFVDARSKLMDVMYKQALSALDIIKQIQKEIWNINVSDEQKIKLIDKCGEIEFRLVEGSDPFIQLEALLAQFYMIK
ncbi:replication factor C small subunit [Candidatus Woesearchaeota archaeon]|nr:replication factor C small subunit [Candidatus Woesearchaeota archaeon]